MNKTKIAIYLALIFLAGAVTGATIGARFVHFGPSHPPRRPGDPEEFARHLFQNMKERLKLSADQAAKIEPIFRAGFEQVRSIQDKSLAQVEEAISLNHAEIASQLTEEQKSELAKMDQERKDWSRKRHHGPPPPAHP